MDSKRKFLQTIIGLSALGLGLYFSLRKNSTTIKSLSIWDAELRSLSGELFQLKALQGNPLLINFWASWCVPCVEEIPLLDRFYQQSKPKNLQLLGIAADKPEAVKRFLAKTPIQFPTVLAGFEGIGLSQLLGNESGGLPFTVLLNTDSKILFAKSGQLTANDLSSITNLINVT